jgi:uncharacterized protein YggE
MKIKINFAYTSLALGGAMLVSLISFAGSRAVMAQTPAVPLMPPPMMASSRTITVIGSGSAGAVADRVTLGITVSSADQTATAIFVKQNDVIKHLKEALENGGIKDEDITEQQFRLMPNMEYGQAGTKITGYRLDTPLEIQIDNVKDLPHIIDLATQSGASSINVGAFGLSGTRSLHDEALKSAIADARKEATSLAKEMGRTVGDVVSISETVDEDQAAAQASQARGGEEEEEEHHAKKAAQQPSTLNEKAQVKVVFELR